MFSGFQPSGYQHSGYQIVEADEIELLGGGAYVPAWQRHREEEYQRKTLEEKRVELRRINEEIAEAEEKARILEAKLKAENAAIELAELEASLQDEINRLRMERVWLMRLIDDEEAILVLLLSMPLH